MKTIKIFGKTIPIWILAVLLTAGIGSATLLTYYGRITSTVDVSQAIILDCTNNECSDTLEAVGSETGYSNPHYIQSKTENDLNIKFANTCDPDCDGVTITNMVELSVEGFTVSGTEFDPSHYKKTYYEYNGLLSNLNTAEYVFKVDENTLGGNTLAPYLVIVSDAFPYGAAVYIIPDGTTYGSGGYYTGTIDGSSKFHVPGDTHGCAVQDYTAGCTLSQIKGFYPSATVSKISYALGAWPGSGTFKAMMGLSKVNGAQAVHKSLTVYGLTDNLPIIERYDFDALITPGTYTIYTTVLPA